MIHTATVDMQIEYRIKSMIALFRHISFAIISNLS